MTYKTILCFILLLPLLFTSCESDTGVRVQGETTDQTLGVITPEGAILSSDNSPKIRQMFRKNFDVSSVELVEIRPSVEEKGGYMLYAEGTRYREDGSPQTVTMWYNTDVNNNVVSLPIDRPMKGQTCSGDPCSACKILEEGGCECKVFGGYCNHTISSGGGDGGGMDPVDNGGG